MITKKKARDLRSRLRFLKTRMNWLRQDLRQEVSYVKRKKISEYIATDKEEINLIKEISK